MPPLENARQERYAQELASGKNATEAYEAAGYASNSGNAAQLKSDERISTRVAELLEERARVHAKSLEKAAERLSLNKEWVLSRLMENAERALQRVPVLDDEGNPTGEWTYQGMVANKALELLGKHLGILIERKEIGSPGEFDRMTEEELLAELQDEAAAIGLALPKSVKANGKTQH